MPVDQELFRAFEEAVNMSPKTLREWLGTDQSNSVGQRGPDGGESTGHQSGRLILALLEKKKKKKAELGDEDEHHRLRLRLRLCCRPAHFVAGLSATKKARRRQGLREAGGAATTSAQTRQPAPAQMSRKVSIRAPRLFNRCASCS